MPYAQDRSNGGPALCFYWLLCHFVPFLFLLYLFVAFIGLYAFFAPFCLLYVPVCLFLYAPSLGPFPFLSTVYPACPFVPCQLSPSFEHLFRPSFTALTSYDLFLAHFCRPPLSGPNRPPFRPFRQAFYGFTTCLPPALKVIGAIKKAGPTACSDTKPGTIRVNGTVPS